jgi:hypothetical protein
MLRCFLTRHNQELQPLGGQPIGNRLTSMIGGRFGTSGERAMAPVIDLAVMLEERRRVLDQVDQAIANVRRLLPPPKKQSHSARQLRLPLVERAKKANARRA